MPENRWRWTILLIIMFLALFLRLSWPTLAEFKRDEATVVHRALAIAYEGDLPAVGVGSSMGMANLPLTLYLVALPLRLWQDPLAAVLFVGLLNGLAVLACYALGRAYFGRTVALVASFLFAVSPWAVLYARKVWCRNMPLFTLAFFAALFATFVRKRPWALVGAFAGLAALVGLQLEGIAFIPLFLLLLLLYRKEVALGPLATGILVFALAMAPYVIDDARHGWPNLQYFLNYIGGEGHFSIDALRYTFMLTGSQGIHGMAGSLFPEYRAGLPNLWWFNGVVMALLALALVYALVQAIRGSEERRRSMILLLLWFAVPILLQSRPTATVHPHYFVQIYPAQFLLIALFLIDGLKQLLLYLKIDERRLSIGSTLLVVALLVWGGWQVAVTGRLFFFMDRYPSTSGYGIPLKYTRAAARAAQALAGPADIVVLSPEKDPAAEETPSVFQALLFDHPHRFADGRWALPVSDQPGAVHLVGPLRENSTDLRAMLDRLAAMAYEQAGPVIELPDGVSYRLFYRDGPDREDVLAATTRFAEPIPFANGVTFFGYEMAETARAGEPFEIWLAWWVRQSPPPDTQYHFFVHLVHEEDGLQGQHDGAPFPTRYWYGGDLVLNRFAITPPSDLPPGFYQIWTGLYTYPGITGVPYLDEAGNPAGNAVLLAEIEILP